MASKVFASANKRFDSPITEPAFLVADEDKREELGNREEGVEKSTEAESENESAETSEDESESDTGRRIGVDLTAALTTRVVRLSRAVRLPRDVLSVSTFSGFFLSEHGSRKVRIIFIIRIFILIKGK